MEWIPMILPILAVIICYVWFKSKTIWWEAAIPVAAVAIFILIFKVSAESIAVSDTEFWNGTIQKAEYYEPWDEYIHQTCTRSCCCDSKGENCGTETYDCSYVERHSEYWLITDDNGISKYVSQTEFNRLVGRFGGKHFVDLGRDYHSYDGDKYVSNWPGQDKSREILVSRHSYENRVQASHSVSNFEEISEEDYKLYGLYDYPGITKNHKQRHLIGLDDKKIERQLEIMNAKLGKHKQISASIYVYQNRTMTTGEKQEAFYKGGNKNEFIVCLGMDSMNPKKVSWVRVISCTEVQLLKLDVRNYVLSKDTFELSAFVDYLQPQLQTFKRKEFKDFAYLEVELTDNQMIWIWVISFLLSGGIGFWVVANPIEDGYQNRRYRY